MLESFCNLYKEEKSPLSVLQNTISCPENMLFYIKWQYDFPSTMYFTLYILHKLETQRVK